MEETVGCCPTDKILVPGDKWNVVACYVFVNVYREICWFNKHPVSVMKKQTYKKTKQASPGMECTPYLILLLIMSYNSSLCNHIKEKNIEK